MIGNLYALDSDDGTVRFKNNLGGAIAGGVITYQAGERQYVAATSGNVSRFIWGETGLPYVVILRLSGDIPSGPRPLSSADASATPANASPSAAAAADPGHGATVYSKVCAACHGSAGEGLSGPALVGIGKRRSVDAIAAWVMNPVSAGKPQGTSAMPRLYPSVLTERDVRDVASFVSDF
jgi:cytochrome c5